ATDVATGLAGPQPDPPAAVGQALLAPFRIRVDRVVVDLIEMGAQGHCLIPSQVHPPRQDLRTPEVRLSFTRASGVNRFLTTSRRSSRLRRPWDAGSRREGAGVPHSSDENTALVDRAVHDSAVALRTVLESMERLDADALRAPSALPGWSRGHVLAHIDGAGNAAARQAEAVARGERVEFYDGGRQGRDTAIEAQAGRTLEEHAEALTRLAARLDAAWPERGSELWDQPTS